MKGMVRWCQIRGIRPIAARVKLAGGECIDYALTAENGWYPDFEELEKIVGGRG